MGGQIFTLALAAPQKHGHAKRDQADPGKDKEKTRRAEAAGGLEVCTGGVSAGSEPAPLGRRYRLSRLACEAIRWLEPGRKFTLPLGLYFL
jgi:hypothetical protein